MVGNLQAAVRGGLPVAVRAADIRPIAAKVTPKPMIIRDNTAAVIPKTKTDLSRALR